MKIRAMMVVLAMSLMVLGGCSRDPEDVAEDAVDNMNELVEVLEGVTDVESAKAAVDEVKELMTKQMELAKEGNEGDWTEEEMKAAKEKYNAVGEAVGKAIDAQIERIQKASPEAAQIITKAMSEATMKGMGIEMPDM